MYMYMSLTNIHALHCISKHVIVKQQFEQGFSGGIQSALLNFSRSRISFFCILNQQTGYRLNTINDYMYFKAVLNLVKLVTSLKNAKISSRHL